MDDGGGGGGAGVVGLGWWVDRSAVNHKRITAETKVRLIAGQAARLRTSLELAQPWVQGFDVPGTILIPDFSLLDEPLVEP